jgi:hypothetical protein
MEIAAAVDSDAISYRNLQFLDSRGDEIGVVAVLGVGVGSCDDVRRSGLKRHPCHLKAHIERARPIVQAV